MKIPTKIKIGAITYKVILADEWIGSANTDGETFTSLKQGNVIYIKKELSNEMKEVTFLHEVLHCINATMNHEFLDSLSFQLHQVLSDNEIF